MGSSHDRVLVVRPNERRAGPPTPGMARQEAFATEGMWAGSVRTETGVVSAWHHHGEYETAVYVLDGALKVEFGPGGVDAIEAGPGDWVYIPKHVVHRESDPSDGPADAVVVRAGQGESTFNVDGPEGT